MSSLNGPSELVLPDVVSRGFETSRNDQGRRHFRTFAEMQTYRSAEKESSLNDSASPKRAVDRLGSCFESRNKTFTNEEKGTLTVKDVIDFMNKTKNKWGVSGYDFPKFDPNFDKSF